MGRNRHINIPVFIPHMGCPHACVFCNQKRISGTLYMQTPERVEKILEESFLTIKPEDDVEIAFFGGSFTGLPEDEMISYLEVAKPYIEQGRAHGIRLSTRPDTINSRILVILKKYGVKVIELGVQSLDLDVLLKSQRGHSVEDVLNACALIRKSGIELGIQTMMGLPGDSFEKSMNTARGVIELKPDMIRIYPALVLKGTLMEDYYLSRQYKPLSVDEAVDWCAQILPLYKRAGITVLRIGLQGSETLEDSIIAGPYHPAFGELVESRILLKRMFEELDRIELPPNSKLIIRTFPSLVSKLVGQKRSNIEQLKEKYHIKNIDVLTNLNCGEFTLEVQKD